MEVSPGWRPSLSYLVHPDIASLASRPPLGISGAPLKARSRDLEAGGPRTFSGLDPGRSPTEAHTQARASRKPPEKPKRAREKHNEREPAPLGSGAPGESRLSLGEPHQSKGRPRQCEPPLLLLAAIRAQGIRLSLVKPHQSRGQTCECNARERWALGTGSGRVPSNKPRASEIRTLYQMVLHSWNESGLVAAALRSNDRRSGPSAGAGRSN